MSIMGQDEFWSIVARAREGIGDTRTAEGAEQVAENLGRRLAELSCEAAVAFDLRYTVLGVESCD
jgi:hypothetical protein